MMLLGKFTHLISSRRFQQNVCVFFLLTPLSTLKPTHVSFFSFLPSLRHRLYDTPPVLSLS